MSEVRAWIILCEQDFRGGYFQFHLPLFVLLQDIE